MDGAPKPSDASGLPGPPGERRRRRSTDTLVALGRLLDSARSRAGLEALAVADETGILVTGSGAWGACEELAARAPLLGGASGPANDTVPSRLDVLASRTGVRRIRIDGIEVLVCGSGPARGREAGLAHAAAGCERILGGSER